MRKIRVMYQVVGLQLPTRKLFDGEVNVHLRMWYPALMLSLF